MGVFDGLIKTLRQAGEGAFYGFDNAARSIAADIAGGLGNKQAQQRMQGQVRNQQSFINQSPVSQTAARIGSFGFAPAALGNTLQGLGTGIQAAGGGLGSVIRSNPNLNTFANQVTFSPFGRNVATPLLSGLATTTLQRTGLGKLADTQNTAVRNNAQSTVLGFNPFEFAGTIAGDPLTYLPVGGANAFKAATKFAGQGALRGALEPAENLSEFMRNVGTAAGSNAAFGGGMHLTGQYGLPLAKQALSGAKKVLKPYDAAAVSGDITRAIQKGIAQLDQPSIRYIQDAIIAAEKSGRSPGATGDLKSITARYFDNPNYAKLSKNELATLWNHVLGSSAGATQKASELKPVIAHLNRLEGQGGFVRLGKAAEERPIQLGAKGQYIGPSKKISPVRQALDRVRNVIESQGPAGKTLSANLQAQRDRAETLAGGWVSRLGTVRKLSKSEFDNFIDVAEGQAQPINARVGKAAAEWDAVRSEVANAGGDLLPGVRENYFPHRFDPKQFERNWQSNIQHLIKTGQATNADEAAQKLRYAADVTRNRKFGNLEAAREVDLPGYERTKEALLDYIEGASNRISQAEIFGPKDEKSLDLINQIAQSGGDADTIKHLYDIAVGAKKYSQGSKEFTGLLRRIHTTTKLGLGAITNVGQNVNTATVTGAGRTISAMIAAAKPEAQDFALKAGVTLEGVLNDVKEGGGFTGKVIGKVTAPGFGKVERFNRSVAAWAGKGYAEDLARQAVQGSKDAINTLSKMGLNADEIIKRGGQLTESEAIKAARNIVERTQFKVDPQDLPGWASSPWGKTVTQFKTFSYNQTAFLSNEIIKPFLKGDMMPVARFLAIGLPVGAGVTEARNLIQNRKPEENPVKRGQQYLSKVGGLGLVGDAATAFFPQSSGYLSPERRSQMAAGFLLGPTFSEVTNTFSNASQALQGRPDNLGRQALRNVPVVGPTLQNTLLPYQNAEGAKNQNFSLADVFGGGNQSTDYTAPTGLGDLSDQQRVQLSTDLSKLKSQLKKQQLSGDSLASDTQAKIETIQSQLDYSSLSKKVSDLSGKTGTSVLEQSRVTGQQLSLAKDIGRRVIDGTLTAEQALPLVTQLGFTDPKQVEYALAKDLPDAAQAEYVLEELRSGTKTQQLIEAGVLTSSVATKLYEAGAISQAELNGIKNTIKPKTVKAKKPKKISITLSAPKTRLTNVTRSASLQIKLPKPKLAPLKA